MTFKELISRIKPERRVRLFVWEDASDFYPKSIGTKSVAEWLERKRMVWDDEVASVDVPSSYDEEGAVFWVILCMKY